MHTDMGKIWKGKVKNWLILKKRGDSSRNWSPAYKERESTRRRGNELAGYLTLQLHAQEALWTTKAGWWMWNSLRKGYTQMHSLPCELFQVLENNKKEEWVSSCVKNNPQTRCSSEWRPEEKEKTGILMSQVVYFFRGVWLMHCKGTAEMWKWINKYKEQHPIWSTKKLCVKDRSGE